jgi:hypothetical protein
MKKLLLLFLLLPTLLLADWDQLFSEDDDPSLFHHVNVVTGNLNLYIEDGVVQGAQNLSLSRLPEKLGLEFIDKSLIFSQSTMSIDKAIDNIRKNFIQTHQSEKITLNIIEKNQSDCIYETIVSQPSQDIASDYQLTRAFLTDKGLHQISVIHPQTKMNAKERERWIALFRESVSIVNADKAEYATRGLSINNRFINSVDLGAYFADWKSFTDDEKKDGSRLLIKVPPEQQANAQKASLYVAIIPNQTSIDICSLFEMDKKSTEQEAGKEIKFHILSKSPSEIIYRYVYPTGKDNFHVDRIVRNFISESGFCSVCYDLEHQGKLDEQEILQWKERLEAIKIKL